eukprot:scaffold2188_cov253-Pinguiococcus_pyrenoidosus.AAC.4
MARAVLRVGKVREGLVLYRRLFVKVYFGSNNDDPAVDDVASGLPKFLVFFSRRLQGHAVQVAGEEGGRGRGWYSFMTVASCHKRKT